MDLNSRALAAIVLAAGKGKRMASSLAKVLHPLGGRPLIRYVVDTARQVGADPIVVVVGHQSDAVQATFENDSEGLLFALQVEQLGTGHAASVGDSAIKEKTGDVLILCGDVPLIRPDTLHELVRLHRQEAAVITILTAIMENPVGYGRVLREGRQDGHVTGIREDADATEEERGIREINTGTYVFDLPYLSRSLPRLRSDNEQNEYYITDLVFQAVSEGQTVAAMPASNPEETMGVNSRDDLARAESVWIAREKSDSSSPNDG